MRGIRSNEEVKFCQFISPRVRRKISSDFHRPRAYLINVLFVDVDSKACEVAAYCSAHRPGEFFEHEFSDPALISRDSS